MQVRAMRSSHSRHRSSLTELISSHTGRLARVAGRRPGRGDAQRAGRWPDPGHAPRSPVLPHGAGRSGIRYRVGQL